MAVLLLCVGYFAAHGDQGTDEAQILSMIERTRQAVQDKNLSDAMSHVSADYRDGMGINYDRLRMVGVEAFRSASEINLKVYSPKVKLHGENADVDTQVSITVGGPGGINLYPARAVTLKLRKEPTRRFMFFHVQEWKIISTDGLPMPADAGA